jgi:hypothetical protein
MSTDAEKLARVYARRELRALIADVTAFEERTQREEYTDTGDAWEVFHALRERARAALRYLNGAA